MSHVTYAEIYGREMGMKEGLRESLRETLVVKFPQDGSALAAEFASEQDTERLKSLLRIAVLALSPEDFRTRVASSS